MSIHATYHLLSNPPLLSILTFTKGRVFAWKDCHFNKRKKKSYNKRGSGYLSLTGPFSFLDEQGLSSKMTNPTLLMNMMSQSRLHKNALALQFSLVLTLLFSPVQSRWKFVDVAVIYYSIFLQCNQCFQLLQDLAEEKQNIDIAVRKMILVD